MRLDLQPPVGIRAQPSPRRVAAAREEVPPQRAAAPHRELLLGGALSDAPLARTLARAVQQRVSTAAADPRYVTVARVPPQAQASSAVSSAGNATATDRVAFIDFWTEIETDVGATAAYEDLYASFIRNAAALERDPMFYPVVQDMYGQIDDLIAAYLDDVTIDQMAEQAGF